MEMGKRVKIKLLSAHTDREMKIRFPPSIDERIRVTARAYGISRAEVVRRLVSIAIGEDVKIGSYDMKSRHEAEREEDNEK